MSNSLTDQTRKFDGKTLSEWDEEWELMEGGFSQDHPSLYGFIGLYRAELNNEVKFIGIATEFDNGGFSKRLQTIRSSATQSGNDYTSGNYIRDNIGILTLRVIKVGRGAGLELIVEELKKAMMKKYGLKKGKIGKQQ